MTFHIRHDRVKNGDVILSTVPRSFVSAAIRVGTLSRYSHAFLVVDADQGLGIEAVDVGVRNFSIGRVLLHSKNNAKVLRHRTATAVQLVEVCRRAQDHMQKRYSLPAAIASQVSTLHLEVPSDAAFCSYLVAAAFEAAHLPLSEKDASKVSPGDLDTVLLDVTDAVIAEYVGEPSPAHWYLDGRPSRISLHDQEIKAAQNVLADVRPLVRAQGYSEPFTQIDHIREFISWYVVTSLKNVLSEKFTILDEQFLTSLQRSGYMTLHERVGDHLHFYLFLDAYLEDAISTNEIDVRSATNFHEEQLQFIGILGHDLTRRTQDVLTLNYLDAQLWQLGVESKTVKALIEQRTEMVAMSRALYNAGCRSLAVLTNAIRRGAIHST